jgi:hypothetical protein
VTVQDALAATLAMGLDERALEGVPMTGPLRQVSSAQDGGEGGARAGGNAERPGAAEGQGGRDGGAQAQEAREGGTGGQAQGGGRGQSGGQADAGRQTSEFREFRTNAVNARGGRGGGGGGGGRRGGQAVGVGVGAVGEQGTVRVIRRALVFVVDSVGGVAPRAVDIGLSDWVRTEIVAGVEEGDRVALVGAAQLQERQQELSGRAGGFLPFSGPVIRGGGPGGGGGGGGRGGF